MYRIVIVEDSKLLRVGMVNTLDWSSQNCQVVGSAGDGLEGLELIRRVRPDIVMTDIRMPGLSGLEMVNRAIEEGIDISVIFISGYDEFRYAKEALKLGAVEYLVKPLEDEDIYQAVRSACEKTEERRKLKDLEERLDTVENSKMHAFMPFLDSGEGLKSEYTQQAIRYIEEHYQEEINLHSIAEALSISESHLSKVFKDTMRVTIGEYLTNYRISEACKMLKDPHYRIYEIAEKCGYSDQRYFSVLFKRVTGVTPNEFRAHATGK